jgi:hypothetical protein
MKEFTFGELKQGLYCCVVNRSCRGCPLYLSDEEGPEEDCTYQLMSAAFNCINVMEKDLEEANKRANDWEEFAQNMSKER